MESELVQRVSKSRVALRRLGVKGIQLKKPEQLQNVAALIIPSGESTSMAKLAEHHNLTWEHVKNMAQGVADIGKGATQGAVTITKGGVTSVAQGTA